MYIPDALLQRDLRDGYDCSEPAVVLERGFHEDEKHPDHILMQFTGLHDKNGKNGKEIYEGDVIRGKETTDAYGNGFMYQAVVIWDDEQGRWIAKEEDDVWSLYDFDFEEVIGNIYENPELINPV